MTPKTQKQWTVAGKSGFDDLKFTKDAPIPEIGDKDVLVKCTHPHLDTKSKHLLIPYNSPSRFPQLPRPHNPPGQVPISPKRRRRSRLRRSRHRRVCRSSCPPLQARRQGVDSLQSITSRRIPGYILEHYRRWRYNRWLSTTVWKL